MLSVYTYLCFRPEQPFFNGILDFCINKFERTMFSAPDQNHSTDQKNDANEAGQINRTLSKA